MRVKKTGSVLVTLALAITVVAVLSGPAEAAGKKCRNIAHRAMYQGTEEQVRGVRENARWGFSEVDARMTADSQIVALHDFNMARATGGKVRKPVGDLTLREIRDMKFVLGRRAETTRRLIRISSRERRPIMVTINSYTRYKDQWDNGGLAALAAAAQNHRFPSRVYFGGFGGEKAMREAFPEASIFHRYGRGDDILQHAIYNDVDLAAIPPAQFRRRLVRKLKEAGVQVASTQLSRKRSVRRANKVGINLVQTNNSRRTVRRWCR
jgi:glycerophosphoryl diester phosphodiesterase